MSKYKINDKYKDIIDLLESCDAKHNICEVFRDFITMFAISIKNAYHYSQDDENRYLEIAKKYSEQELKKIVKMCGKLLYIYSNENEMPDILGEIFSSIGAYSKEKSQIFTPRHIAGAMAAFALQEIVENKDRYITIIDSTCGSGVLGIGAVDYLKKKGVDYRKKVIVKAKDIDSICFYMTYVQLSLYNIPGVVILGNSLTNEEEKVFYTPAFFEYGWKEKYNEQ